MNKLFLFMLFALAIYATSCTSNTTKPNDIAQALLDARLDSMAIEELSVVEDTFLVSQFNAYRDGAIDEAEMQATIVFVALATDGYNSRYGTNYLVVSDESPIRHARFRVLMDMKAIYKPQ